MAASATAAPAAATAAAGRKTPPPVAAYTSVRIKSSHLTVIFPPRTIAQCTPKKMLMLVCMHTCTAEHPG